jgi:hypothetical protein
MNPHNPFFSRILLKNNRSFDIARSFNMANCAVTSIANALQLLVWLPLLSVYGFLSGVLFNALSCFSHSFIPHASSSSSSSSSTSSLPQRVAAWCKQEPAGFGGKCGGVDLVGEAALACQSGSDQDDEFFNCAQCCFGSCATLGWAATIALALPGCCATFALRQACGADATPPPAAQGGASAAGASQVRALPPGAWEGERSAAAATTAPAPAAADDSV